MKNLKIVLLSLLTLAAAVSIGCGGGGTPTFTKLSFNSDRDGASTTLFLMNLDGTNVTPATNGPDDSYSPSVSANAKKIVYVSEENVWSINSDGSAKTQLTSVTDDQSDSFSYLFQAKLSPNGKTILYSYYDGANQLYGVWSMNVDGTAKTNLTATLPTDMDGCYGGTFSPDSKKIAFGCFGEAGYGIYAANADGSNAKSVVPVQGGWVDTPMFTPDGKKLLFFSNDFNEQSSVRSNAVLSHKPGSNVRVGAHSRWTSHGIPSNFGIYSTNLDGTGTPTLIIPGAWYEGEILNSTLYYKVSDNEVEHYQIWKANPDGTGAARVSDGTANDQLNLSSY